MNKNVENKINLPFKKEDIPRNELDFNRWLRNYKKIIIDAKPENMTKNEYIGKLYKFGFPIYKLAQLFDMSYGSAWGILEKENVKRRTKSEANKQIFFNDDFFKILDSEYKCYWLGFLLADGYINEKLNIVGLKISRKDEEHLKKFAKHIRFPVSHITHSEAESFYYGNKPYQYSTIQLYSKTMKEDLTKLGCTSKKSLTVRLPKGLTDEQMKHVIRGFFDGDGSFGVYDGYMRITICSGSKEVLEDIQNYFERHGIQKRKLSKLKKSNTFTIYYGKEESVVKIYNLLHDDELQLDRKLGRCGRILKQRGLI